MITRIHLILSWGNDAFGLRTYLMKPYSNRNLTREQRITNYRFSKGRRVVENAFRILLQRWQVLLTTMQQGPDTVRNIVEACVCLHNLKRSYYPKMKDPLLDNVNGQQNVSLDSWRDHVNMHDVIIVKGSNRDTVAPKKQREYLKLYFNSPAGALPWQDRMIDAE
uniref:DDE Tnp4 domain-containing protein n=1 Tax=Scylla olivacea TaxID=85551 RepID=A0A0P4VN50_SCYOL